MANGSNKQAHMLKFGVLNIYVSIDLLYLDSSCMSSLEFGEIWDYIKFCNPIQLIIE